MQHKQGPAGGKGKEKEEGAAEGDAMTAQYAPSEAVHVCLRRDGTQGQAEGREPARGGSTRGLDSKQWVWI